MKEVLVKAMLAGLLTWMISADFGTALGIAFMVFVWVASNKTDDDPTGHVGEVDSDGFGE